MSQAKLTYLLDRLQECYECRDWESYFLLLAEFESITD
jgi:hypothetical protein